MKKKIKITSIIFLILLIISCVIYFTISIINDRNIITIKRVKIDFINELIYEYPFSEYKEEEHILLGQYNDGYIFLDIGWVNPGNLPFIPETIEIDGISITKNYYTELIYFEERCLIYGLEEMYNNNYIDKDDLIDIKKKLDQHKDNEYIINKDYKVKYILDYSKVIEKQYTIEEIKIGFLNVYNKYKDDKQISDFYLLGKYSIGYLLVTKPTYSVDVELIRIKNITIFYNRAQEFYFYYPPAGILFEGLDNRDFKTIVTYDEYNDIKNKLELFKNNYYLVQYDFDIE